MSVKEKSNTTSAKIVTNLEDRGLAPASSGTSMPKVKPAAKPKATTNQGGKGAGDKKS